MSTPNPVHSTKPLLAGPSITIVNPPTLSGGKIATEQPDFTAYGYVNPTTASMSAWAVDSNNNQYAGTAVTPPPQPYNWAFSFNLPSGTAIYTLVVQGITSDGTTNATVKFSA